MLIYRQSFTDNPNPCRQTFFAQKGGHSQIMFNACHPGVVETRQIGVSIRVIRTEHLPRT